GGIDLNMYSFPVIVASLGMLFPALFVRQTHPQEENTVSRALMTASVITAVAATLWLLSPLRLQAEMGVFLIVAAFLNVLFMSQLRRAFGSLGLVTQPSETQT